jgi:cyclopropane-fatty-acyl-phospholipid synthase
LLPHDGRLLLHTIVWLDRDVAAERGFELQHEDVKFLQFLNRRIFPGGQLRPPSVVKRYAEAAGFEVTQVQSLCPHYARTLDAWADNLRSARAHVIDLTSHEVYRTYMHYLTGCAQYFHREFLDVMQFTCCKPGAVAGRHGGVGSGVL